MITDYTKRLSNIQFSQLNFDLDSLRQKVLENQRKINTDTMTIHIDNINHYRSRFEKAISDKYKYKESVEGDYTFSKQLYDYFKEILNRQNIPFVIVES